MESIFIWIITAFLILVIFIPYWLKFHRHHKADIERKQEAQSLGIDRARAQFPFINDLLCIGCGSCVAACPEGDVLGVVFGKARVINGLRCIGHGICEEVCPVGALKVGLGDIKKRDDIPILSKANETTVSGLYIAGELSGLSLLRNAVAHGRKVVENIAQDPQRSESKHIKDVIIVGAGPAGMSAALTAIQNDLSYTLLDQQEPGGTILQYPRKKVVMAHNLEIPLYGRLKRDEYSKEELLDIWQAIIRKYKINYFAQHRMQAVVKPNGYFKVITNQGDYEGRKVILAMGRRGTPRKLGVPGEESSKVAYQLIDAQSYTNHRILVVGGGDSAVEAAIGLARQKGNKVTLSYRKNKLFRIKKKNEDRINEMIKSKKITSIFNSNVIEIKEKSVVLKQTEKNIMEIPNDYVFIFAGGIPPFKMLKEMGIQFGGDAGKNLA